MPHPPPEPKLLEPRGRLRCSADATHEHGQVLKLERRVALLQRAWERRDAQRRQRTEEYEAAVRAVIDQALAAAEEVTP